MIDTVAFNGLKNRGIIVSNRGGEYRGIQGFVKPR
ncbi:unnamed protein product, partial [Rotaria sp. Silwood2]